MVMERPPKGYNQFDRPLKHFMPFTFSISAENSSGQGTIIAIALQDGAIVPSTVNVHPEHASYVEEDAPNCALKSIINRVTVHYTCHLSKGAIETDKMRFINFIHWPTFVSFDDIDSINELTGITTGAVLELTDEETDEQTFPLYTDTKLTEGFTYDAKMQGLTTTQVIENVTHDMDLLYDTLNFASNRKKVASMIGKIRSTTVNRDRPYVFHSDNFINSKVKRMNKKTGCFLNFHMPQVFSFRQYGRAADMTAIDHLNFMGYIKFNEWNLGFNQDHV